MTQILFERSPSQALLWQSQCNCSGKDTLESYTKEVNTGKNEKEVFEENVIS